MPHISYLSGIWFVVPFAVGYIVLVWGGVKLIKRSVLRRKQWEAYYSQYPALVAKEAKDMWAELMQSEGCEL